MNGKSKEPEREVHKMKNKVSVREESAYIVIKRATVTNITHYEYCFDNNLKNKRAVSSVLILKNKHFIGISPDLFIWIKVVPGVRVILRVAQSCLKNVQSISL